LTGAPDAAQRLPQGLTKNRENNPMQSRRNPGYELIGQL
jgi:hypothetical protein